MKQDKQDRRSQRTRHLVNAAMMELMRENHYASITVQDILDRSGIGRSTFYAHFFDKEDVLTSLSEQLLEMLRQRLSQRDGEQKIVPSLELFQHAQENYQFFQAMLRGRGGEVLWDTGLALLSRNIEQALTITFTEPCSSSVPLTVVSQYLARAFLSLLKWWIEAEMPYSPERMDEIFQQLALPGVWTTIEGKSAFTERFHT